MRESDFFRQQAQQCRSQAVEAAAPEDRRALSQLAQHYEREAKKSEVGGSKPMH